MTSQVMPRATPGMRTPPGGSPVRLRWTPPFPVHLGQTLRVLARGAEDPTVRVLSPDRVWIATRWEGLPVSACFSREAVAEGVNPLERDVMVEAWGPGAPGWLPTAPRWVGAADDWKPFETSDGYHLLPASLTRARHQHPGLRLPATGTVLDRAVVSLEAMLAR